MNTIKDYITKKYNHQYATTSFNYIVKYFDCYQNPSKLLTIPTSNRANVLKALIMLSKFRGEYESFRQSIKQHGIKWIRNDNFATFLNIVNHSHSNLLEWYHQAKAVFKDNERLFLKFTLLSGLRKAESIRAFNKIVSLANENRLSEYYDKELLCLCHFKYPSEFMRNTKNVYITPIEENLVNAITQSKPVSYQAMRKRLTRNKLTLKFKTCRSYYATYLRKKGIMAESIDLVQGRIEKSIFVRFYLKQTLKDLNTEVLGKLKELESLL